MFIVTEMDWISAGHAILVLSFHAKFVFANISYELKVYHEKAFNKLCQSELFKLLGKLDLFGKDIRIIQNLYWEKSVRIQIENTFGKETRLERVYNKNVFSLDFNLYSEARIYYWQPQF